MRQSVELESFKTTSFRNETPRGLTTWVYRVSSHYRFYEPRHELNRARVGKRTLLFEGDDFYNNAVRNCLMTGQKKKWVKGGNLDCFPPPSLLLQAFLYFHPYQPSKQRKKQIGSNGNKILRKGLRLLFDSCQNWNFFFFIQDSFERHWETKRNNKSLKNYPRNKRKFVINSSIFMLKVFFLLLVQQLFIFFRSMLFQFYGYSSSLRSLPCLFSAPLTLSLSPSCRWKVFNPFFIHFVSHPSELKAEK